MQDLWAGHRTLLHEAISSRLDDARFKSGELAREQIEASEPGSYDAAALACLAAAEAVGGSPDAALPGAVAIAFMSQMALVFTGLENSGGAASLSTAWGMPRSLNAGDAMFALAQSSLLSVSDELRAEVRLRATGILDLAAREMVDALFAANEDESDTVAIAQAALLPQAMALGALLGDGDEAACECLATLGRQWALLPAEDLTRSLSSDPGTWLAT